MADGEKGLSLREEQIVEKMPLGTEVIPLQSPQ